MALPFTKIPSDAFEHIQENAGILVASFDPATREFNDILGTTSGGINFSDTPTFKDFGEDIDNCPKNVMELKKIESRETKISGTFKSLDKNGVKTLMGAADFATDNVKIIPRDEILTTDFKTIWFVCDYGVGGYIAIKLMNTLTTGGFQVQTANKDKGSFSFEFTCHPSMSNPEVVPYEVYIEGGASTTPHIVLDSHTFNITVGDTHTLRANVIPTTATVTWNSSSTSVATVLGGVVSAEGAGNAIITASITQSGVTYNDTCTVIVEAAT